MDFARYIFSLIIVGGLLALLYFASKRYRAYFVSKQDAVIQIVSVVSVGPKERLVVVSFGEKTILLGVTPGSISRLSTFRGNGSRQLDSNVAVDR